MHDTTTDHRALSASDHNSGSGQHDPHGDHANRQALLSDPGVAKALREYRRSGAYGKITGDYAALVVARKITHYAARALAATEDQIDPGMFAVPRLPSDLVEPIWSFVQAEQARDQVLNAGKLSMFSDQRKQVWDQMRDAARVLADLVIAHT